MAPPGEQECVCREKLLRLQHENKMLRVQQEPQEGERIAALQEQLEDAHRSRCKLDTDNRYTPHLPGELDHLVHIYYGKMHFQ